MVFFTQDFKFFNGFSEPPPWLNSFSAPLKEWKGLGLDPLAREDINNSKASLLQLRSYLFTRQLQLLLRMNQPQQVNDFHQNVILITIKKRRLENNGKKQPFSISINKIGKNWFEIYKENLVLFGK